jgi:hypothetical protein
MQLSSAAHLNGSMVFSAATGLTIR